jgi:hypothetical protein
MKFVAAGTLSQGGRGCAIMPGMPALTRRRSNDPHRETWNIAYGDVIVGHIRRRSGVPVSAPQWGWSVGFHPGMKPGQHRSGVAATFAAARAGFEEDWHRLLPQLSVAAFDECRRSRAFHAWKSKMWATGCKMPTQAPDGRSQCFCGAEIGVASVSEHVYAVHMHAPKAA